MRFIRKRITVVNDGWTKKNMKPARERGIDSATKYIKKMAKLGWYPFGIMRGGDAFKVYEYYVHLQKATTEHEKKEMEKDFAYYAWALEQGEITGRIKIK